MSGRLKRSEYNLIVRTCGGKPERRLQSALVALPLLLVVSLAAFALFAALAQLPLEEVVYPGLSFLLAMSCWAFYRSPVLEGLNTPNVIDGILEANRYSGAEKAYLVELSRYRKTPEGKIHATRAVEWARQSAGLYLGSCLASLVVPIALFPFGGPFVALVLMLADASLSSACLAIHRRRLMEQSREAQSLGFRLKELAAAERRQQTRAKTEH